MAHRSPRSIVRSANTLLSLTALFAALPVLPALADDGKAAAQIFGWRRDGSGHFPDAKPPLSERVINHVIWRTPLPNAANASPALTADRVFVTAEPTHLICLDRADGKILWDHEVNYLDTLAPAEIPAARAKVEEAAQTVKAMEAARTELDEARRSARRSAGTGDTHARMEALKAKIADLDKRLAVLANYRPPENQPEVGNASPTPITDGKSVWALFGNETVASFTVDGKLRWARHFDLSPEERHMLGYEHGVTSSPLLIDKGKKLIIGLGYLRALDADTGKDVWTSVGWHSFGTPSVARVGDTDVLFTPVGEAVRASDGRLLAKDLALLLFVGPVTGDGLVIFAGTYDDHGPNYARARAYALPAAITGDKLELKLLWEKPIRGVRIYATPIFYHGHLFVSSKDGLVTIFEEKTGTVVAERALDATTTVMPSPAIVGDRLFVTTHGSPTVVLRPAPPFEVEEKFQVGDGNESAMATPVFDGTRQYVRARSWVVCTGK